MARGVTIKINGDADGFKRTVGEVENLSGKIGSAFSKIAGAAAAVGVGSFFKSAVDAASDLNEVVSKTEQVFGDQADTIEAWGDTAAKALGQSKQEALGAASSFGNLFLQLGIAGDRATSMSQKMVELASDFASFHNADITEVLEAQTAAFRGEYDSVQKFVPTIQAATVEQKAMAMGLAKAKNELDAQDKALATYAILTESAGKASGDFARTADGLANKQRILAAEFKNAQAQLGQSLLPTVQRFVGWLSDSLIPRVAEAGPIIGTLVSQFADVAAAVGGALGSVASFSGEMIPFAAGAVGGAMALVKLVEVGKAAVAGMQALGAAATGAMGPLGIIAGMLAGAAAFALVQNAREAKAAKESYESFTAALRAGNDATVAITDSNTALTDKLLGVKRAADGAAEAVGASGWIAGKAQAKGLVDDMTRLELSMEDMSVAAFEGGAEWREFTSALGLWGRESAKAEEMIAKFPPRAAEVARKLYEANVAAKGLDESIVPLISILSEAGRNAEKMGQDFNTSNQRLVESAEHAGLVTREMIELAKAQAGAGNEAKAYAGLAADVRQNQDELRRATSNATLATQQQSEATAELTSIYAPYKTAAEKAADAADELADNVSKLKDEQDKYLGESGNYEEALDNYREKLFAAKDALGESKGSLNEWTKEGRDSRAALRDLADAAAEAVAAIAETGGTADQQKSALENLAEEARIIAEEMGVGADEAQKLADRIRKIPTSVETTVRVTTVREFDGEVAAAIGSGVQFRAEGGPVRRNAPYVVGEEGPELMVPDASGVVVPNSQLRSLTRQSSQVVGDDGAPVTVINITANGVMAADKASFVRELREMLRLAEAART